MRCPALVIALAVALATISPAAAQATPPAATASAPLDPARLAAASTVVDLVLPPATRDQLVAQMMTPMLANLRQGLADNPDFAKLMAGNPQASRLFAAFMDRQQARSIAQLETALPGMVEAMTHAYARRFDVVQLNDIHAFLMTPSGRAYIAASFTIMSDPDVAAWQRGMITDSMSHVQEDVAAFAQQIAALPPPPPSGNKP